MKVGIDLGFTAADVRRAAWTLVMAFVGGFMTLAAGIMSAPNLSDAKAATIAAIGAGIAAVISVIKNYVLGSESTIK